MIMAKERNVLFKFEQKSNGATGFEIQIEAKTHQFLAQFLLPQEIKGKPLNIDRMKEKHCILVVNETLVVFQSLTWQIDERKQDWDKTKEWIERKKRKKLF